MPIADAAAEHRMYLPLAAVVAFVVIGGYAPARQAAPRGERRTAWTWPAVVVFLIVVALGCLTALRNLDYRSEFSIWDDTVRKAPDNPRAINGRGKAYFEKHDYERAIDGP